MEIYLIENLLNGKKYVGQTKFDKYYRFKGHLKGSQYIDRVIKKYGKENFKLSTLETVENEDDLNEREIYWIKKENTMSPNGYNLTEGGAGKYVSPKYSLEKSLINIFCPVSHYNKTPRRIKMVIVDKDIFMDKAFKYIDLDSLKQTNMPLYLDVYFDFLKTLKKYLKHNNISMDFLQDSIYKIIYYPSISSVVKFPPQEAKTFFTFSKISSSFYGNKLIDFTMTDNEYCFGMEEEEYYSPYMAFLYECSEEEFQKNIHNQINQLLDLFEKDLEMKKSFIEFENKRKRIGSEASYECCKRKEEIKIMKLHQYLLKEKCFGIKLTKLKNSQYRLQFKYNKELYTFVSDISEYDVWKQGRNFLAQRKQLK